MEDAKPASRSLTIISNVLTMAVLAAGVAAPSFTAEDQAAAVQGGSALVGGALQLVSIWGRVRARKRIR